jgi:hypothetical protein
MRESRRPPSLLKPMKPWTDEMSVQGFLRLGEERRREGLKNSFSRLAALVKASQAPSGRIEGLKG